VFAALAAVEFHAKIKKKTILASEQDAIDCDIFSNGCEGGWPSKTFQYVEKFGISDGRRYKYTGPPKTCQKKSFPSIHNISDSCEEYLGDNEEAMKALVAKQPVIIGFDVTADFMYYKSGVYVDDKCTKNLNHAMVSFLTFN
jgi:cathepsin L